MNAVFTIIFGSFIFLIWISNFIVLCSGWETLQIARQSRRWLTIQGRVDGHKSCKVTRYVGGTAGYGSNPKKVIRYSGVASFSYTVNGVEYTGGIFDNQDYTTAAAAERAVEKIYPVDTNIDTFYNPKNPKESVLSRGFTEKRKSEIIFSLSYFSVGFNYVTAMLGTIILQEVLDLPNEHVDAFFVLFGKLGSIALCFWVSFYALNMMQYAISRRQKMALRERLSSFLFGCLMLITVFYVFKFYNLSTLIN